jgi:hypothetical protein
MERIPERIAVWHNVIGKIYMGERKSFRCDRASLDNETDKKIYT